MLTTAQVRARWLAASPVHMRVVEFLNAHEDDCEEGACVYYLLMRQYATLGFVSERWARHIIELLAQRN